MIEYVNALVEFDEWRREREQAALEALRRRLSDVKRSK